MNADKNEPGGKRVSPRPAWLTERPAGRVRKDLAAFFEFFTPLTLLSHALLAVRRMFQLVRH